MHAAATPALNLDALYRAESRRVLATLICLLGDFDLAETQLQRALDNNYKDPDAVRFYLGQASEERKRFDDALKWYAAVSGGEQFIASRARYANVLVKQGRMAEAREYLQGAGRNAAERLQFIQIEAQLLR